MNGSCKIDRPMKEGTYSDYRGRIEDVVHFISGHLDEPLTIGDLAARAFMSPFHFQRVFARVAGERCGHMVRRLRLERAAWQLQNTEMRIADIAFDAGFESQEAFARSFRAEFASAATDFREAQWLSHHLLTANLSHFEPVGRTVFRPLARRGEGLPFDVVDVEPFEIVRERHHGAPHLMEKTLRNFVGRLVPVGFSARDNDSITYAE